MKPIRIFRDSNNKVVFAPVTVVNTDTVFFINEDNETHWPTITADEVAPSQASSEAPAPDQPYGCRIPGHPEVGVIKKVKPLSRVNPTLQQATNGQQITEQQVVSGGASPYTISGELFEVRDSTGTTIQSGSGSIGPGLHLIPKTNDGGVFVGGTPTVSGTYLFAFTVDDGIEQNLQPVQCSMKVV